ncbi:hypothetical protein Lepto7375DRAFT_7253 [Leptolyngbya sp. PCC 7375]|nr:hypothetical protein Lepto7375DRAFT_7253 [Leptolyngbya sp. PCC 7375]
MIQIVNGNGQVIFEIPTSEIDGVIQIPIRLTWADSMGATIEVSCPTFGVSSKSIDL